VRINEIIINLKKESQKMKTSSDVKSIATATIKNTMFNTYY